MKVRIYGSRQEEVGNCFVMSVCPPELALPLVETIVTAR